MLQLLPNDPQNCRRLRSRKFAAVDPAIAYTPQSAALVHGSTLDYVPRAGPQETSGVTFLYLHLC